MIFLLDLKKAQLLNLYIVNLFCLVVLFSIIRLCLGVASHYDIAYLKVIYNLQFTNCKLWMYPEISNLKIQGRYGKSLTVSLFPIQTTQPYYSFLAILYVGYPYTLLDKVHGVCSEPYYCYYSHECFVNFQQFFINRNHLKGMKKVFILKEPIVTERILNISVIPIKLGRARYDL